MKDKFSDDLHIYRITEKRNLLNLHVLKFDPSILDFKGKSSNSLLYLIIHRTPLSDIVDYVFSVRRGRDGLRYFIVALPVPSI